MTTAIKVLWRDPDMALPQLAYIDGSWCPANDGATLAVFDPATGREIGRVPNMGALETERAIQAAVVPQRRWARRTAFDRAAILRRWGDAMHRDRNELAQIITLEQSKPLDEANGEIDYAASFLFWFAEEGCRQDGEILTSHLVGRCMHVYRVPIGVTAAITPWNFPSAMITRKAGAALAAGCAIVVRPPSETPFSALALAALAEEAGVPAGVMSVVTGDPEPIAGAIMDSSVVRQISFTGSTRVGRLLAAAAGKTVKRVALELGGHAPMIILEDADLEAAVDGAVSAKFQTSGQDCLAANRIFVASALYDAFCLRFTLAVRELRVGNGFDPLSKIGPLINEAAVKRCQRHVADAVAKGARLLIGGNVHPSGPLFFEPTVLADVTPDMAIFREETFGPVAPILAFSNEPEVIAQANDSEYGLAAYIWGSNLARTSRIGRALEYGMVSINGTKMTGPPVPFGGVKQSGLGREGSRHGIAEYSELKYMCINDLEQDTVSGND